MGMFDWLKPHSARDAPVITNSVRDSGQIFTFGRADSGEKVDARWYGSHVKDSAISAYNMIEHFFAPWREQALRSEPDEEQ